MYVIGKNNDLIRTTFSQFLKIYPKTPRTATMGQDNENKLPTFRGKSSDKNAVSYSDFRFKVQAEANAAGETIWPFMTEEGAPRPTGDEEKAYNKLYARIVRALVGDALEPVKDLTGTSQNAKMVIQLLDKKYLSQTTSARISAISRLVTEKQGEKSIEAYVNAKKTIWREDLQGKVSPDEMLIGSLVAGLAPKFDSLVDNIVTSDNTLTNIDDLVNKLREHERRAANRDNEVDVGQSVAAPASANPVAELAAQLANLVQNSGANALNAQKGDGKPKNNKGNNNNNNHFRQNNNNFRPHPYQHPQNKGGKAGKKGGGKKGNKGGFGTNKGNGGGGQGQNGGGGQGQNGGGGQGQNRGGGYVDRKCYICNRRGHESSTCWWK